MTSIVNMNGSMTDISIISIQVRHDVIINRATSSLYSYYLINERIRDGLL